MLQNKHEKGNLHGPHDGRDLQYTPARRYKWPTEYTGGGLADGLDGSVDEDGFFMSVGKIVCGHSGAEEGDDEEEGAEDCEKESDYKPANIMWSEKEESWETGR
jgi:hypothetical protein